MVCSWMAEDISNACTSSYSSTLVPVTVLTKVTVLTAASCSTGEMVYSWMAEDYAWLRPLKGAAEALAHKDDWSALYDAAALRSGAAACAALVSYDDIYVERHYSEQTAALLGERCKLWVTNEFQHSGLRDDPSIFGKLDAISRGEIEY